MLSRVKLTNVHTVRGRPTLKNNTECFRNGLVRELKEKQRKLSRHSMTSDSWTPWTLFWDPDKCVSSFQDALT